MSQETVTKIERNSVGQLVVHIASGEEPVVDAKIVRCFPWSLPGAYISILDAEGKEIALLESLENLDPKSRALVDEELRDKVFNPRIQRVLEHKNEFGVISITAETDRGTATFQLRSRDDVHLLSSSRAIFRDADGNTYELVDYEALDPVSQRHLMDYF